MELTASEKELLTMDILEYFDYKYGIPKSEFLDNEIYYDLYQSDKRYNIVYGGRGSGKSREVHGKLPIVLISCLPFCRYVSVRQIEKSIKGSTYQEMKDFIEEWDLQSEFKILKSPKQITHIESGNYIEFVGMDNPDSVKSIKDATHVGFEEFFQVKNEKGVSTIDKSIRTPRLLQGLGVHDIHKLYITFNPDNKNHHVWEQYFDPKKSEDHKSRRDNSYVLQTTHKNNKFLPKVFRDLLEAEKKSNPERWKVDCQGKWGELRQEGLYYSEFDGMNSEEEKLYERVYRNDRDLYLTFDFNVFPYISLEINQLFHDKEKSELQMCTIDEILVEEEGKYGKVKFTMQEFLRRYSKHNGRVVIVGDRSGHSRKTTGTTDYATVKSMLKKTSPTKFQRGIDKSSGKAAMIDPFPLYEELKCRFQLLDKTTQSANPSLLARRILFERLHSGQLSILPLSRGLKTINASGKKRPVSAQYANVKVVHKIDPDRCPKLLKDYYEVQTDVVTGGKNDRDKTLTHTSDAQDYLVCMILDMELAQIILEMKR